MSHRGPGAGGSERGSVAILTAILMVVLVGFAALVVDVGLMFRVRNELQNAADSAALAGAQLLNGKSDGITASQQAVQDFANQHQANNSQVSIAAADIVFGHWYQQDGTNCDGGGPAPCFQSLGTNPTEPRVVNAVKVTSRRTQATGDQVQLFFGGIFGRSRTNIIAEAIAIGGGPAVSKCAFPMVVPDCAVTKDGGERCDYCMRFQDANSDNAGWTTFGTGQIGGPQINELILAACYVNGEVSVNASSLRCEGACTAQTATVDQDISVQNGNLLNKGANSFCETIQDILRRGGPPGTVAQPFVVDVPVIDGEGAANCDVNYSSQKTVVGYATMTIYGAKCSQSEGPNDYALVPAAPSCSDYKPENWPPPSDKWVVAELKCGLTESAPAGGGNFFLDAVKVRLVH